MSTTIATETPVKSPCAGISATVNLTDEQIAFYHREGYLVVENISTQEEVAWLRTIYDRLFEQRAGRADGNQFDLGGTDEEGKAALLPQILGPSKYAPEMVDGLYRANATKIASQLLGPNFIPQGDHAIRKPERVGPPTPWHQDEAYWGPEWIYNAFSLWMPLQDTPVEMGCMWFVPGTQQDPIFPHHSIGHDPRVHGLEMDNPPDISKAVACPLKAGSCTIHSNRTMHYAGPNTTETPRRAYIVGFGLPATKRDVPQDFYWNRMKNTARDARAAEKKV